MREYANTPCEGGSSWTRSKRGARAAGAVTTHPMRIGTNARSFMRAPCWWRLPFTLYSRRPLAMSRGGIRTLPASIQPSPETMQATDTITRIHGEIRELARQRNAVILAHNYERPEVQDVADYVGDSLGLSREAAKTDADVIVFCGVHFMAETAAILSPSKTVLLPDLAAGCSLASFVDAEQLIAPEAEYPRAAVV